MSNQVTPLSPPMLFVGIDWASRKHDLHWIAADGRSGSFEFEQSSQGVLEFLEKILQLAGEGVAAVLIEKSRGPLHQFLMGRPEIRLYQLDPKQMARYRESYVSSNAKNDTRDAIRMAQLIKERHHLLQPHVPTDEATRRIAELSETRRRLVNEKTAIIQQITQFLQLYFPVLLTLGPVHGELVRKVLQRWPNPQEFRRLHPKTLRTLLTQHRVGNQEKVDALLEAIRKTPLLLKDSVTIECTIFRVQAAAGQLEALLQQIHRIEEALRTAFALHPDAALFQQLPGAGACLAPRLLAAFGSCRDRFGSAEEVAVITGIAPVTRQSGKYLQVTARTACSKFLKQTFHEFALASTRYSSWARAFYQYLRAQGTKHHAAIRKLAAKWIRILFKVWKNRTPYDEQRYIKALTNKKHPLLKFLNVTT